MLLWVWFFLNSKTHNEPPPYFRNYRYKALSLDLGTNVVIPREILLAGARRLASRVNPRVKDWSGLGDRAERDRLGLTLAEGARLTAEGLDALAEGGFRPVALLVSDSGAERDEAGGLFARAGEAGLERFSLTDECFAKVSGLKNADGLALVMACVAAEPFSLPAIVPGAMWLAAAGVQDPGNAGALARTALAAGFTGCLFLDGADPRSPKFLRGSMGAAFRLPCRSLALDAFVTAWERDAGNAVLALASARPDAVDYREFAYRPPLVLAVGGERGVPPALERLAGVTLCIPMQGGVESLNLAVAAGIVMFEANRRGRK